jgi:predicted ArsR family transcriptional regulator
MEETIAMDTVDLIPVEMRWRLAARTLTYLPFAYEKALADMVGAEYSTKVGEIYRDLGREMASVAQAFCLPTEDAADLAMTVGVLVTVLFGPGFEGEPLEVTDERAVLRFTRCPFVAMARELGVNPGHAYIACNAFKTALIESLNEEYKSTVLWARCFDNAICELTIERKEESMMGKPSGATANPLEITK